MSDGAWKIQDLAAEGVPDRAAELGQLFPEAMTDGKVDIDKLRLLLGEEVEESPERYGLTWPGKRDAIRIAQKQSTGTLDPMPSESVDWDATKNVIIEGDNLEVLKLLQKSYYGKVKLIYIDPPYNTGNDFVYNDDFKEPTEDYLQRSGQIDGQGFLTSANRDTSGRFHSDWLNMMYPRLLCARNLLSLDGAILISIDQREVANLQMISDEIFGGENFVAQFTWETKRAARGVPPTNLLMENHEYVLCYAKDASRLVFRGLDRDEADFANPDADPRGLWRSESMKATGKQDNYFSIEDPVTGRSFYANWAFSFESIQRMISENLIIFPPTEAGTPRQKKFIDAYTNETKAAVTALGWHSTEASTKQLMTLFDGKRIFDFPKPLSLLGFFCQQLLKGDDIAMDFFAGSGGFAQAVLERNALDNGGRRFILVQLPEATDNLEFPTISDITRERVRRAGKKVQEEAGDDAANLDVGFRAFKLTGSHFRNWDSDTDTFLAEDLQFYVDNIDAAATDEQIVHEIMLKAGVPLDTDLETFLIDGNKVYLAMGGLFAVSANRKITQDFIDGLLALEPWPAQIVLLDAGFGENDSLKLNARHQFASRRSDTDPDKDNVLRTV